MPQNFAKDEPYCSECGYRLTGCTDSARCPECGRPLVEVLTRGGTFGRRYRSTTTLFGLPVIDVAIGPAPGEKVGHARGIFAVGDRATGFVAFGGIARGIVACGGVAMGGVCMGGVSLGLIGAWGGLAIGLLAAGGCALGGAAYGGLVFGLIAFGGLPVGIWAMGGSPVGLHTLGAGGGQSEPAEAVFAAMSWFYGPPGLTLLNMIQPVGVIVGIGLALTAVFGVLAALAHRRQSNERSGEEEPSG